MNYFSKKRELEKYAQIGKISHELFHDILNPISGLVLYFEMFKNLEKNQNIDSNGFSLLDTNIKKEISQLNESGERIRNFIKLIQNNLLEPETKELLDIYKEIQEIISLSYHKAKRNNVSIIFIQNNLINIKMSKIKFYQLIINLISNGIDSFEDKEDKDKRKLIIKCEEIKNKIVLEFIDNGCGIKKEDLNKIFKRNYSNKNNGLGIGLKTVKKIIREINGEIRVKSLINKGTTFKILVPKNR